MARENRKKRHEKRFGKPDRIADMVNKPGHRFGCPKWADKATEKELMVLAKFLRNKINDVPKFYIDSVADYYYGHDKKEWDYQKDFPGVIPPYDVCWFEARRPKLYHEKGMTTPFGENFPSLWGGIVSVARNDVPEDFPSADEIRRIMAIPGFDAILRIMVIYSYSDIIIAVPTTYIMGIDSQGNILSDPLMLGLVGFCSNTKECEDASSDMGQFVQTILLAMALLNCNNVSYIPQEPNREINRLRERNGLKPFHRYHILKVDTINKKPRIHGKSTGEGPKKAWHTARGHMATYTEERPLFGIPGLHGKFWIPQHERGSKEIGIVTKDYDVDL